MNEVVVHTAGISKEYLRGQSRVMALDNVNFTAHRGQFMALMGPSGSGKSTLLISLPPWIHPPPAR